MGHLLLTGAHGLQPVSYTHLPLTPQLRAIDSINPQDGAFPNALRGGVTTACTCLLYTSRCV